MAQYLTFSVAGADTFYRLTNGGFSGEAGDSFGTVNGMAFSTIDQDHDTRGKKCYNKHNNMVISTSSNLIIIICS